ncbi:MAG: phage protein GemA/Gp16 family protein [Planctomycetaceae bacterium]|nr:regulatory protein GemA [Planctomycetaceae bacterium]
MNATQRLQQYGRIHKAKKNLGLDDAAYRQLLTSLTGVDSCKAMTDRQVNHALDWLNYFAGVRYKMPTPFGRVGASGDAKANLVALCYAIAHIVPPGWTKPPLRSMQWQERTCGRCSPAFEDMEIEDLTKLIEGVKAIFYRMGLRSNVPLATDVKLDRNGRLYQPWHEPLPTRQQSDSSRSGDAASAG